MKNKFYSKCRAQGNHACNCCVQEKICQEQEGSPSPRKTEEVNYNQPVYDGRRTTCHV